MIDKAEMIIDRLEEGNFQGYIVGGYNRDKILGKDPKDIDIVTDATPDQIESIFDKTIAVGKSFGTIVVVIDGDEFEVTTYRKESGYSDGRHPDKVEFAKSIEEDYKRRDFTCNAIYSHPLRGILSIEDPAGGREDLKEGFLRAIGNPTDRITEDPLRMLRALRIASINDLNIDGDLYNSITLHASLINGISKERIVMEMDKAFSGTGEQAERFIFMMAETNLMQNVIYEVMELENYQQPIKYHFMEATFNEETDEWDNNVLAHTLCAIKSVEDANPDLIWSILLHDIAKPFCYQYMDRHTFHGHEEKGGIISESILKGLKFPSKRIKDISMAISIHRRPQNIKEMKKSTIRKFINHPQFDLVMELHHADAMGSCGDLSGYNYVKFMQKVFEKEGCIKIEPCLINGGDLIELGLKPSKLFKEILDWAMEYQIEFEIKGKETLLFEMRHKFKLGEFDVL